MSTRSSITVLEPDQADEHRCQNPKCRKSLAGRRSDTKFCSPACRFQVKQAERPPEEEVVFISSACRFPRQQQAEIVLADQAVRHPFSGPRPEFSGYCVVSGSCECKCHE